MVPLFVANEVISSSSLDVRTNLDDVGDWFVPMRGIVIVVCVTLPESCIV